MVGVDWPETWRAAGDWYAECVCVAVLAGNPATAAVMLRRWERARERQDEALKVGRPASGSHSAGGSAR